MRLLPLFIALFALSTAQAQYSTDLVYNLSFQYNVIDQNQGQSYTYTATSNFDASYGEETLKDFREMVNYYWEAARTGNENACQVSPLLYPAFDNPMLAADFEKIIHPVDTMYTENPETGEFEPEVIEYHMEQSDVAGIELYQKWYYDKKSKKVLTRTYGVGLLMQVFDEQGKHRGFMPFVVFKQPHDDISFPVTTGYRQFEDPAQLSDGLLDMRPEIVWGQRVNVMILCLSDENKQVHDFRPNRLDDPHYGLAMQKHVPLKRLWEQELPALLHQQVQNGASKAYLTSSLKKTVSKQEIRSKCISVDTTFVEDLETGEFIGTVTSVDQLSTLSEAPYTVRVKQEIRFDPKNHRIIAPVVAIGPCLEVRETPVYWIEN